MYLHHKIHLHVITECKLADAWVPITIASLYGSQRFHCGFCNVNSPIFNSSMDGFHGFTSGGQELGSAAVQASKHYVGSLPLVLKDK